MRNSRGGEVSSNLQVGNSKRVEGYPSTWKDPGAGRTCRAGPGAGESLGPCGAAFSPSTRATFRAFLSPLRVLAAPGPEGGVSNPRHQRAAPFPAGAPGPLPPAFPLRTRSPERKGDGAGGAAETSPHRPFQKARPHRSEPGGRVGPCEQRGALFSAVVSWPFDLSAAGEMLLTFG